MSQNTTKRAGNSPLSFLPHNLRNTLLSISFFLLTVFWGQSAMAQTDRLPTTAGDGGFENASPSGWTIQNSALANTKRWLVGTTATAGYTGTYSAFIRTTTGTAHTYTNNVGTSIARIYRTIDLTAYPTETNITLSFLWICGGEAYPITTDRMRVWVEPSSTAIPAITTAKVASGVVPTGVEEIPRSASTYFSGSGSSWTTFSVKLNPLYAGTSIRLIFEWVNNADSVGANPPAGIDDVSLTTCVPPANDNCAGVATLTVNPLSTCTTSTAGTTVNAIASPVATVCGNPDDDVWYQFTTTKTSHIVTVTPSGGTPLSDAVFQVFSTSCGGTSIACQNSTSGAAAEFGAGRAPLIVPVPVSPFSPWKRRCEPSTNRSDYLRSR